MEMLIEKIKRLLEERCEVGIYILVRKSGNVKCYFRFYKSGVIIGKLPCWLGDKFQLTQVLGAPIVGGDSEYYVDDKFESILRYIFKRFDVREIRYEHGISFFLRHTLWKKQ